PRKRLRFSFITELSRLRSDDLPHHLPGNTEVTAYRLDRLTVNKIRATDLSNRLHDQHSNLGSHENGSQCGPSVTGSRLDADHPEKRGPYSMPKHTQTANGSCPAGDAPRGLPARSYRCESGSVGPLSAGPARRAR